MARGRSQIKTVPPLAMPIPFIRIEHVYAILDKPLLAVRILIKDPGIKMYRKGRGRGFVWLKWDKDVRPKLARAGFKNLPLTDIVMCRPSDLLSAEHIAALLHVSVATFRKRVADYHIPKHRVGRKIRYDWRQVRHALIAKGYSRLPRSNQLK